MTEIGQLEADLDNIPTKKSRQIPTIPLDEIAKEVEKELGPIVVNGRQQPNINVKKLFCFVAMELGHHPTDVGKHCGVDRTSAIHHWNSMKHTIWMCGIAQKLGKK